ncbi:VQ domain-containing protein [Dioscorea alata]|uniref:VQ domain-containing protein n=1 Tax=Dioscorea alata TaxID=55571 RepID=A0ACB7U7C4_DIOAL|nr:VQ domain-containing protein [Dioscorea alata]
MFSMDHSCNSGSLQSSSGCEEDYVSSKPNSLSNFFNSCLQPPPPPPPPPSSSFFDAFPTYLDSSFPTPLPDHNHNHNHQHHHHDHMDFINISSSRATTTTTSSQISSSSSSLQHQGISSASRPKISKKRTRASRRAPTTVLTTDTSNFRAMVQEFTGIPTASFMPYSTLPPPRFDLLHSVPPYLLRPFAQKVVHSSSHLAPPAPPAPPPIDVISSLASIHSTSNIANTSATAATCSNSNIAARTNTSLGLNMQSQNPIQSFQSMQDHQHANISAAQLSSRPLDFDWQKGGQSEHQTEERGGSGIDSWVLSSD